jgi:hypothetical protein
VLEQDRLAVESGEAQPEPLVLHVNIGDCIEVDLSNETNGAVSFHADMLSYDPAVSGGIEAGRMPAQAVLPSQSRAYTFFASPEVGETTALIRDWGDVTENPSLGLYGAIVVGPEGAAYRDVYSNDDVSLASRWQVNVHPLQGGPYRDYTLFMQDEDESIGTHRMPYTTEVTGPAAINYQTAPLEERLDEDEDTSNVFRSTEEHGDPETPLLEAYAGEAIAIHVLAPSSEQSQVFTIEGHEWPFEPQRTGSDLLSAVQLGGLEAITIQPDGGAGGRTAAAGDYLYGNHREPYREAGQWGLLRVHSPDDPASSDLLQLSCGKVSCDDGEGLMGWMLPGLAVAVFAGVGIVLLARWRGRANNQRAE